MLIITDYVIDGMLLYNITYYTRMESLMGLIDRFNKKWMPVTESGCWIWVGSIGNHGYGQIRSDGKLVSAHRLSWELHNGAIPDSKGYHGVCVLHRCDVRACVNPDHLFLGTHQDNMSDKCSKNRQTMNRGESHPQSKLTNEVIIETRHATGTQAEIALRLGISQAHVSMIRSRKRWSHI